jgi:hypothetical protein
VTLTEMTYAQQDALARLGKKYPRWDRRHDLRNGLVHVLLPGDEPIARRRRVITKTGLVERVQ